MTETPEIVDVSLRATRNNIPELEILDLDTFLIEAGHIARLSHRIDFYQMLLIVQEYAVALAISPKKLNKITHLHLGKPTKQVIDERVVLEIKRLLSYSDLSMQEIAYLLGFSDPTNMTKFFKRYTSISPAQFKSSFKKAQIDQSQAVNHL